SSAGSGGGSWPESFRDSALGSVLPGSPVSSAVPRISTDWYGFAVSNTVRLTRGSRVRLSTLRRVESAENSTVSPSRRIHTTEVCGPPSGFTVATVAKFLPSRSSRVVSSSTTATEPAPLTRLACPVPEPAGPPGSSRHRHRDFGFLLFSLSWSWAGGAHPALPPGVAALQRAAVTGDTCPPPVSPGCIRRGCPSQVVDMTWM